MSKELWNDNITKEIRKEIIDYLQRLHKKTGEESNNKFKKWDNKRILYKTGKLYRGYKFKVLAKTSTLFRCQLINDVEYSKYLNEKYPHVYINDKISEIIDKVITKEIEINLLP